MIVDIANIIVALGVIVAITQININRKQLHFDTIARCIEEFRKLDNLLGNAANEPQLLKYIDLVNEELFYFQHNYLPKVIALEWIDGMLDYLTLLDTNSDVLNKGNCIPLLQIKHDFYLRDYPRIVHSFTIRQDHDLSIIYSNKPEDRNWRIQNRKAIIEEIYNNVQNFSF